LFGRVQRPEPDAIEVIIGPRATFNGHMRCDTSVRIDGSVEGGHIETPANVILTETARVQCDITAKTVSIRGLYKGVLRADRVELLEGSQIYGSLYVNSFYMDDGVLLRAELNIQGANNEKQFAQPRPDRQSAIPVMRPRPMPPSQTAPQSAPIATPQPAPQPKADGE
jgi:cytoskeletal protein CcmA (bactofilin family)